MSRVYKALRIEGKDPKAAYTKPKVAYILGFPGDFFQLLPHDLDMNKDTNHTRDFLSNAEEMENSILFSNNHFDPEIKSYFQNAVDVACNLLKIDNDMTLEKEKEIWRTIKEKERQRLDAVLYHQHTSRNRVTPSRQESATPMTDDVISHSKKYGKTTSSKVIDLKHVTPESSNQVLHVPFAAIPKNKSASSPTVNSNFPFKDERNHKLGQEDESTAQFVTTLKNNDGKFLKQSSKLPAIGLAHHFEDDSSSKYVGDQEMDDASMKSVESERSHSICGSTMCLQPGESWPSVWKKMNKKGWKYVKGNLEYANLYIKPGKNKTDGEFNVDYFSIKGAQKYMKTNYNWTEEECKSNSSSSSIEHDNLVLECGEPWKRVWSKLVARGWRCTRGNLEHTHFYVKPGKKIKDGKFGVDYFGEGGVKDYMRANYRWIEDGNSDQSAVRDQWLDISV